MWPGYLMENLKKQKGTSSEALCIISKPSVNSKWNYSTEMLNLGRNRWFFVPCDLKIWQMTLKNNRAHLRSYFKLCASFHSHLSVQNGVTVRKRQICVKIGDFFVPGDLEFWRMTLKNNMGPLLRYFVYHWIAFCEMKMKLHSGNTKFGSIWRFFVPYDLDRWHWKTIGHLFYSTSSLVHHLTHWGRDKMDAISQTTLSNAFLGMKMFIGSDGGLAPSRRQAIIWINDGLFTGAYMRHSASMC